MKSTRRTAFHILCRCLTGALGQPLTTADLPASPAEWEKVLRLSSAHLVTPQLRWALRAQGLFSTLPADAAEYLEAVYTLNLEKNTQCEDQLAQFIQALNCIGVRPLLLKGAAVLVGGLYPTSGERMVTDLDVLIPVANLPEILAELASVGYQTMDGEGNLVKIGRPEPFLHHHYPPVYHPDWPVMVELHVHPVVQKHGSLLANEELFHDATPFKWRAADCLLPAPRHLLVQNIIHTFLVDTRDAMKKMSLRQAFEFVLASGTYEDQIDWNAISERFETLGYGSELRQYLALANTCFNSHTTNAIRVEPNDQAKIRPHLFRLNTENRAALGAIDLLRLTIILLRSLRSDPRRIRRLIDPKFYLYLFHSIKRL